MDLRLWLADHLPPVNIDPEQFKRVVINLVDNAAEAMHDSLVRTLMVETQSPGGDTVEMVVSDTGPAFPWRRKRSCFCLTSDQGAAARGWAWQLCAALFRITTARSG